MKLEEYVGKWWNLFDINILADTLNTLDKLYKTKNIFPQQHNVFRAFHECKYDDCKVVIIGSDPYPQKNVANGLAFSNNIDNKNISPSLQVLLKASGSTDKTLESWCKQGILLLNTALSVVEGKPSSHLLLWRPFIKSFLKNLSEWETGMIYVLLGKDAQGLKLFINTKLNDVLEENHPAYYARLGQEMPSTVFTEMNNLLINKYNQKIKL